MAVEVYPGNTGDPTTVPDQVEKLRQRCGLARVVLVGDRGMLSEPQIGKLREHPGLGWISALRGPAIRALVESGSLQLSLFDESNLAEIALKAGRVVNRFKVAKHFTLTIANGVYVARTSEPKSRCTAADTVRRYKSLAQVERAFRTLKGIDLRVRPIHHRTEDHVRAHVFLCMLAYYLNPA